MRILLTGGTGFIGSHLKARLLRDGHQLDLFTRDSNSAWSSRPDAVINCAGELDDAESMVQTNVGLAYQLLEHALENGVKRVIQIGSSSELGPIEGPRAECDPVDPTNLYEGTKAAATQLCLGWAGQHDMDVVVARPFTIYGSNDKPRKLLPTLWRAFKDGKPFTCYPGGHDWTHVDDFVEGICLLLKAPREETQGQIYHFGTGISTPNEEIVRLFERAAGALSKVEYRKEKLRPYDVMDWRADSTKAHDQLGWVPKIDVEAGVHRFVMDEWFKQEQAMPGL